MMKATFTLLSLLALACLPGCNTGPAPTVTPITLPTSVPTAKVSGPARMELQAHSSQTAGKQNGSILGFGFQPSEHIVLTAERNQQPLTNVNCQIQAPLPKNTAVAYPSGSFACFFIEADGSFMAFDVGDSLTVKAEGDKGSSAQLMFVFK